MLNIKSQIFDMIAKTCPDATLIEYDTETNRVTLREKRVLETQVRQFVITANDLKQLQTIAGLYGIKRLTKLVVCVPEKEIRLYEDSKVIQL